VVIVAAIAGMPRVVQSPPRLTKCAAHAEHGITRIYSPCQRIPRNEGDELDGRRLTPGTLLGTWHLVWKKKQVREFERTRDSREIFFF